MAPTPDRKLLMIPGPIEVSPAVRTAHDGPPPGHQAPPLVEAFGRTLELTRALWKAPADAQPFVIAGSGTLAMDMAVANVIQPGDRALVVDTGYFSERMAEILRRAGADVVMVSAEPGEAVPLAQIEVALEQESPKLVVVTHVDTSTGVKMDAGAVCRAARKQGVLSIVDGVCATGAEPLSMVDDSVDIYLTGSQKALGLPPGLAFFVAGPRALAAREALSAPPALYMDFASWIPIMKAYEERAKAYFATPATNLIQAAQVALEEIAAESFDGLVGIDARTARHQMAADALRAAWASLGLSHVAAAGHQANTLSALRFPAGVEGPSFLAEVGARGVIVAGGLHPALKTEYFRVGHMGYAITQPEMLEKTIDAVAGALAACGATADAEQAKSAFRAAFRA